MPVISLVSTTFGGNDELANSSNNKFVLDALDVGEERYRPVRSYSTVLRRRNALQSC